MDLELSRVPKRKEPINLLTGVFLKSVYFLTNDKYVIVGMFKNRGDTLGVLFKGVKGLVLWSYDVFNKFAVDFDKITAALEGKSKLHVKSDTGEDIKVGKVFGIPYVFLYDGERTISLTNEEWVQFVNNLPLIRTELTALFMNENLLRLYIAELVESEEGEVVTPSNDLPTPVVNRLSDEIALYKRRLNGSGCG